MEAPNANVSSEARAARAAARSPGPKVCGVHTACLCCLASPPPVVLQRSDSGPNMALSSSSDEVGGLLYIQHTHTNAIAVHRAYCTVLQDRWFVMSIERVPEVGQAERCYRHYTGCVCTFTQPVWIAGHRCRGCRCCCCCRRCCCCCCRRQGTERRQEEEHGKEKQGGGAGAESTAEQSSAGNHTQPVALQSSSALEERAAADNKKIKLRVSMSTSVTQSDTCCRCTHTHTHTHHSTHVGAA